MADNLKGIPFGNDDEGVDFPTKAKQLVKDTVYRHKGSEIELMDGEIYLVWFCYILGGWKALCSTSRPDGRYYEVTHKKETGVTFVDVYMKIHQEVYND